MTIKWVRVCTYMNEVLIEIGKMIEWEHLFIAIFGGKHVCFTVLKLEKHLKNTSSAEEQTRAFGLVV